MSRATSFCRFVSALLVVMAGLGETAFSDTWKRYRAAHPFHTQEIVISGKLDESQEIIISEPPPHVPVDKGQIEELLGDVFAPRLVEDVRIRRHNIMRDGWAQDITARISAPKNSEAAQEAFTNSISALSRYLFGTGYGAYYRDLGNDIPFVATQAPPNLSVSAAELKQWLIADGMEFKDAFSGEVGPLVVLLERRLRGTYQSLDGRLVAWVIDPVSGFVESDPDSQHLDWVEREDFRRFTLDSDIVIGAIRDRTTKYFAVIGRARKVPLDALPPLRYEMVRRLAAASSEDRSLAQSYERKHALAGRLNDGTHEGWDWAPIYLSEHLQNTEFGSLLNITDQLLKSWSLGGNIEYFNFPYPDPGEFPFEGRLDDLIKAQDVEASAVLFNWNTDGAASVVEIENYEFASILRTGSLPITYGSESLSGDMETGSKLESFEEKGWSHFSSLQDPNLARVVQYTFLYQLFEEWGVAHDDRFDRHALPSEKVNETFEGIIDGLVGEMERGEYPFFVSPDKRREFDDLLTEVESTEDLPDITPDDKRRLLDFLIGISTAVSQVSDLISEVSEFVETAPAARAALVQAIASPHEFRGWLQRQLKHLNRFLDLPGEGSDIGETALHLYREYQVKLDAYLLAQRLNRADFLWLYADKAGALEATVAAAANALPESGNVKTPSVVISRDAQEEKGVGGHNLDSAMARIRGDTSVSRGKVRIDNSIDGETIIFVHPDDLPWSKNLGRAAARSLDADPERLREEVAAQLDSTLPSSLEEALGSEPPLENFALGALRQVKQPLDAKMVGRYKASEANAEATLESYNGSPGIMLSGIPETGFVVSTGPPPVHTRHVARTDAIARAQRHLTQGKHGTSVIFTRVGPGEIDALSRSIAERKFDPSRPILAGGSGKPPVPPGGQYTLIGRSDGPRRIWQVITNRRRNRIGKRKLDLDAIAKRASEDQAFREGTVENIPNIVRIGIPSGEPVHAHFIVDFKKVSSSPFTRMGIVIYGQAMIANGRQTLNRILARVAGLPPRDDTVESLGRAFEREILRENSGLKFKIYFSDDDDGYTVLQRPLVAKSNPGRGEGLTMQLSDPTSVEEIGIVLGLPTTPRKVAEDILRVPEEHEYAWELVRAHQRKLLCELGISHPSQIKEPKEVAVGIWKDPEHDPYCRAMKALLDSCQEHGVALANPAAPERASLTDLALLSRQKRCLLVIAHWRDARISTLHWVGEVAEIRDRIARLCDELAQLYKKSPFPKFAAAIEGVNCAVKEEAELDTCTCKLNQLIKSGAVLFKMTPEERVAAACYTLGKGSPFGPGMLASRNRDELDKFFGPDLLSPGNRLELGSGFCTASEIDRALSDYAEGVAFIACQSDMLRERITHRPFRRLWGRSERIMPQGWLFAVARALDRMAWCEANILTTLEDTVCEIVKGDKK